jgi:hypothetical protein
METKMRTATKHWLFFIGLLATLAIMAAFVLWQIDQARIRLNQDGPGREVPSPLAPLAP